jgi:tripeptide aminopeptidase
MEMQMINETRLLDTLLALVRIDSPSGEESAMARELDTRLRGLGLTVQLDAMHNLVARLPGQGVAVLLAAHMDTVPGRAIKPLVKDGVVYSDGTTILGADDKAGIAVILEMLQSIVEQKLPHPPIEVVVTVQEELGLVGAKGLDTSRLEAKMGISLDCGGPAGTIVVSAPTQDSMFAVVHGKAAHAGAHPELGINAIVVAADAIHNMRLGRLDEETTANIGIIQGGTARNIVPDRVELTGEARSRQLAKLEAQTASMVEALQSAARQHKTAVDVEVTRSYTGYAFSENDAIVSKLVAACQAAGVEPNLVPTGGGSDANIYNAHGMQVINTSIGTYGEHTTEEYVVLSDMATCARIVMQCMGDLVS